MSMVPQWSRRRFAAGVVSGLVLPRFCAARPIRERYAVEAIELYVRVTPPGRLAVAIGKNNGPRPRPERNPIVHVRMVVRDHRGQSAFGCSADRMSVRWLDKRAGRAKTKKLIELCALLTVARDVYLAQREFTSPFAHWLHCHKQIAAAGRRAAQEDLTASFASALMERAMLDAVCRLEGETLFNMVRSDRLGFAPDAVIPELNGFRLHSTLPRQPRTTVAVRHTVGKVDPLKTSEIDERDRLNDGLPQSLEEYIRMNGQRMFKLKASGDVAFDLARMAAIWDVIPHDEETLLTIDANEAYSDLEDLERFIDTMARDLPDFFARVAYIEQPLPRRLTLDKQTSRDIRRINAKKRLIIDEADGTLAAFRRSHEIGYSGSSHKNCKGLFKSLLHLAYVRYHAARNSDLILSGEDLQNMPIVPLHQDYAAVCLLDLPHCERNGHHFNYGLCMVSDRERDLARKHHRDMYREENGELFLNIRSGAVNVGSLQCAGFGVRFEPDWDTMMRLNAWQEGLGT